MTAASQGWDLINFGDEHRARIAIPTSYLGPGMGQRQILSLPAFVGQAVGVAWLHLHTSP